MLNSHPHLEWKSELFHAFYKSRDASKRVSDPWDVLANAIAESSKPSFGFELKFQHLDEHGLDLLIGQAIDRLLELGFQHFVILRRANYLRQAVSVVRGQLTQMWHVKTDAQLPDLEPVQLDLDAMVLGGWRGTIESCFRFMDETYKELNTEFQSREIEPLCLTYEHDLQTDPGIALTNTLDYMNLQQVQPNVSLKKINDYPLPDLVSNFQQVRQRLAGTSFEWMCEHG